MSYNTYIVLLTCFGKDSKMKETILKMTEAMNDIIFQADEWDNYRKISFMEHAAKLFQTISYLSGMYELAMPKEAMSAKSILDNYYKDDVLQIIF